MTRSVIGPPKRGLGGDARACVTAVVPARNEALCIAAVVQGLLIQRTAMGEPLLLEVLVADNGSVDDTAARALAAGARVIAVPQPGDGQACWQAVQASRGEVLLFVDGMALSAALSV